MKIKQKETERLILRGFEVSDKHAYYEVLGSRMVSDWLGRPEGISLEDTKLWIEGMLFWWERHGYGPWAVIEKQSGKLIGHCGLKFAEGVQASELMYAIHRDYQGKGYASEAAEVALDFGFSVLKVKKIVAFTLPGNWASRKVMEKLGMEYVRNIIHAKLDHVLYEITNASL